MNPPPPRFRSSRPVDRSAGAPALDRWASIVVIGALAAGLLIRGAMVLTPPTPAMMWDHHEYVAWAVLMDREGFTALYDHPPDPSPMWSPRSRRTTNTAPGEAQICNYPPGFAFPLYVEGTLLKTLRPDMASNTPIARVIFSAVAIVGDIVMAWGCFALVRLYGGRFAAAVSFGVALLAPPFFIDSCHWGQTDSWVLAPAVWMVWAMVKSHWLRAGVLWGIALSLKTQGSLLLPIWLFALLVKPDRLRILGGIGLGAGVLLLSGLPFVFHSGAAWFENSYIRNLFHAYKLTTLKAFNVWYVDLLLCENTDAGVKLAGLEKDLWGKILLAVGLLGGGAWLVKTRRNRPDALLRFAAVCLLLMVILPTRVHERYIVLPLPFLICLAGVCRRVWWGLVPLLVAATFQITALDWLENGADLWSRYEAKALAKLRNEYETLRQQLPPAQFAALPPPEEQLLVFREQHRQERRQSGVVQKEWGLTLLELAAAGLCVALAVPGGCRRARLSGPSPALRARLQRGGRENDRAGPGPLC